jgi:hypothetical protein
MSLIESNTRPRRAILRTQLDQHLRVHLCEDTRRLKRDDPRRRAKLLSVGVRRPDEVDEMLVSRHGEMQVILLRDHGELTPGQLQARDAVSRHGLHCVTPATIPEALAVLYRWKALDL